MLIPIQNQPITVAHDYFTQRGGAERVAATLVQALNPQRVVTSVYAPDRTFALGSEVRVETSFLQRFAAFRRDPRSALPALPAAWRSISPITEGVVVCSSSGWSHGVRTRRAVTKVVYCHNPARWLYQPDDYFKDRSPVVRTMMRLIRPLLVQWDRAAAATADLYLANSRAVADRIKRVYGRDAIVLHPPVSIDAAGEQTSVDDLESGYFVAVGRGRGYKNMDHLLEAFAAVPQDRLVVVGVPPENASIPTNVQFRSDLTDAEMRWLYANAAALISVAHEDFGLTPLEANAFGTPALLLRAGGFLDSLAEGVSGRYIDDTEPATIADAVRSFPRMWDEEAVRRHAEKFSTVAFTDRLMSLIATAERVKAAQLRASPSRVHGLLS